MFDFLKATLFPLFILKTLVVADVTVLLGGETDGVFQGSLNTVETYSNACGLFDSDLPQLPKGRKSFGATYLDGSIYVCGGYNVLAEVKECYKLDLSDILAGWIEISPMLKGRYNHHLVTANGLIYAIGGEGPFFEHDDIEIYDPSIDKWSQFVTLTGFRQSFCAVVSNFQDEIFLVGGIDQNNERKRLESLNLTTMEWTRLADMNANRSSLACARLGDGLIASGGWGDLEGPIDTALAPVRTVEYYDPASDTWIEFPAMRHRRTEHVMSVDQDDVISIFGGYQGGHLDTIEVYDEGSEWDYLSQYLQEPKSQLAVAIVPAGIIPENC